MALTLQIADDSAQWDELLSRAQHRTIFHTWKWLKIVEKHTKTKLYPLIGLDGTTPIGIFPIFYSKKFLKLIFSPPSGAGVLYLGPLIIDYENMKQGRKESILFEFLKTVDNFIFSKLKGNYVRIRSSPGLLDSRPFLWNRYEVRPLYTMIVNLDKGSDVAWNNFDRRFRVSIEKTLREGVSVKEGSLDDLDFLHNSLHRRLHEQGLESNIPKQYLHDIFDSFFPQNLKVFIAEYKGQNIGGSIVLCYNNTASLWIGVPKVNLKGIYPNELVQWEIMKWAIKNGFQYYEMMDTGEAQRLCNYKSQINPNLSIFFSYTKYSSKISELVGKSYGEARKVTSHIKSFRSKTNGK